jgi:hypothetical protein
MDAYSLLLRMAAEKRDQLIESANRDYLRTVNEIGALRRELDGEPPLSADAARSNYSIMEMIREVMPTNCGFTVTDLTHLLSGAHPRLKFRAVTVGHILPRMEKKGVVTRVGKNEHGHALWAATGVKIPERLRGENIMIPMVEDALREFGPMQPIELIKKLQERGYRPESDPGRLVGALKRASKKLRGMFSESDDGRWALVGD